MSAEGKANEGALAAALLSAVGDVWSSFATGRGQLAQHLVLLVSRYVVVLERQLGANEAVKRRAHRALVKGGREGAEPDPAIAEEVRRKLREWRK